jgi:valyl-tRNA synthetase
MIMMGLKFAGDVPFRDVYIHALVRDHEGQKMSKSKSNILDPLDLIEGVDLPTLLAKRTDGLMQPHLKARIEQATRKEYPQGIPAYGADALRFTFAALATTGRDIRFDLGRVEGYHRFGNKLWNAAQFVFSHVEREQQRTLAPSVADRWIRSRLRRVIVDVHEAFSTYRFDLAAQALYEFAWHEFCDWYVELTKPALAGDAGGAAAADAARATLAEVLGALLKLLHPLMPFLTEELWLELCARTGRASATIMIEPLPEATEHSIDAEAEAEITWLKELVVNVRQIRGETNIGPGVPLVAKLAGATENDRRRAAAFAPHLKKLAGLEEIVPVAADFAVRGAATASVGPTRMVIPLAGLIDVAAERERLGKQRNRYAADLAKSRAKLANASFLANAPAAVVAGERARVEDAERRLVALEQQIARLAELD